MFSGELRCSQERLDLPGRAEMFSGKKTCSQGKSDGIRNAAVFALFLCQHRDAFYRAR